MAVIDRTECYFKSIRRIQGIVLFLVLFGARFAHSNPKGCDSVRKDLLAKGLSFNTLERPMLGPTCGAESCCGKEVEISLAKYNQMFIDNYVKDAIFKLSSIVDTRAKKFDEFFREMLVNSKREFHEMFERTYGKIYLQNSYVFSDFFTELETYYKKGSVKLSDTMDTFFHILYQRMFTVLNGQYTFDDKYLECVADHMNDYKPFGDVPHKLGVQLRRSFVATRTFYKSLAQGVAVANGMANLKVDETCAKELTKMQQCGVCNGLQGAGTCFNYCVDVLERCLGYHTAFSNEWDRYIDALDKVAERLLGPFNIEMVVEPLNIKISEAIMNFQDSGVEVSKKIYSVCGRPTLNRRRRKASYPKADEDNPKYELKPNGGGKKKHKKVEKVDNTPTLGKLIKEIKMKIKETKQFWLHLPYQYCNNENVSTHPSNDGKCWNGTTIGTYEKKPKKPLALESPIVNEQNFTLQVYIDKLRKAFNGEEVELLDDSEEPLAGSGSGSGDGAEENVPEPEHPDEGSTNNEEVLRGNSIDQDTVKTTSSTKAPEVVKSTPSGAKDKSMSLNRALAQYLIPIVLVWFGGSISELL